MSWASSKFVRDSSDAVHLQCTLESSPQREAGASHAAFHKSRRGKFELSKEQLELFLADAHLSPICVDGPLMTDVSRPHVNDVSTSNPRASVADKEAAVCVDNDANRPDEPTHEVGSIPKDAPSSNEKSADGMLSTPLDAINRSIHLRLFGRGRLGRASDVPILAMPFAQYREVVQWVVEQSSAGAPSTPAIPTWLAQYFDSREVDPNNWRQAVENFEVWFGRAVGASDSLRELLKKTGDRWIRGIRNCRATFG